MTAFITAAANAVIAIALLGELAAVVANVIARSFFDTAFLWTDEVAKLALSTLAFVGGAAAYGQGHHTYVRVVLNALGPRMRRACLVAADLTVLLTAAVTFYASLFLLDIRWGELTPILQIPAGWVVVPLTASMALLMVYAATRLARAPRPTLYGVGAGFAGVLALAFATRPAWLPWFTGDGAITAALALFFLTIFGGLPIGFALLLSTAVYLWTADTVPMVALPQNMVDGTGNFVLLALPFFILAGLIMERGGISLRLVRFVQALVGHLRGGLLHVMVLSMYLVSGLSGAKTADVAAVGSVMRDMLAKEGYAAGEGAAVLAASAAMGETVPPSIAMLVLGSITTLSMAALFVGGLIPAAVVAALPDGADLAARPPRRRSGRAPRPGAGDAGKWRRRHPAADDAGDPVRRHPARHRDADRSIVLCGGLRTDARRRRLSRARSAQPSCAPCSTPPRWPAWCCSSSPPRRASPGR